MHIMRSGHMRIFFWCSRTLRSEGQQSLPKGQIGKAFSNLYEEKKSSNVYNMNEREVKRKTSKNYFQ